MAKRSGVWRELRWALVACALAYAGVQAWTDGLPESWLDAADTISRPTATPDSNYDRHAWKHWIDADRDCQDTRQEALIAESLVPVRFESRKRCKVARGRWRCPFTGEVFTDPHELDVDHLVPLKNAHDSGGAAWSARRKARYANDLRNPDHLIVVAARANRSKGSRGPDEWLPERAEARCDYVDRWVAIKTRWGLRSSDRERAAIDRVQAACASGKTPTLASSAQERP